MTEQELKNELNNIESYRLGSLDYEHIPYMITVLTMAVLLVAKILIFYLGRISRVSA